ncbi:MAG: peptide chain release factor N(5)-glutamine methyltransferase [Lachnospiraceae bacterium]|nr:peptide chain release factor N(5)-glutamine methyltransferase [Lachnospiraceae bacterium]
MNYRALYTEGQKQLEASQIEEASLDARLLLEHICHSERNDLLAHGDREVTEEQRTAYLALIEKRSSHIPLQHLTGVQEFMGLEFKVNEHVLIPRQDTETLVEEAMKRVHDGMQILDMCTGSGCILLSLLHYSNDCTGTGVDLSWDALAVARENAARLREKGELRSEVSFLQSDLFTEVRGKYDVLVSNPPYIQTQVIRGLMPEVREHEPLMALDGREDGLYFYEKIISQCGDYLNRGADVLFEIGYDQGAQVKKLMEDNQFIEVQVLQDLAGLDRVVAGTFHGL